MKKKYPNQITPLGIPQGTRWIPNLRKLVCA
jgi:hypothetical protein